MLSSNNYHYYIIGKWYLIFEDIKTFILDLLLDQEVQHKWNI